jgi:cytochrome c
MKTVILGTIGLCAVALAALAAPISQAQTAPNGQTLFVQRCAMCHQVAAGGAATIGPNLRGVVGRRAAATSFAYSAPLRASNLTWTRANLDRYLTAPARMVPGTRMAVNITDAAQRRAILDYLARQR